MVLNKNISQFTKKKKKDSKFNYWLVISHPIERGKINIPFETNKHIDSKLNYLGGACTINFNRETNQLKEIRLISDEPNKYDEYDPKCDSVAIDFGLNTLFSLSNGSNFGIGFNKKLSYYDSLLNKLTKTLQSNGITKLRTSKKYVTLVSRIRNFIKNEINRNINRVISLYRPSKLILENLNFSRMNLSKKLNRLISKCGLGVLNEKLESISLEYGIEIIKINPSFTSQECNSCGYISKKNRKTQSEFICGCCGLKTNADYNASRSIHKRFMNSIDQETKYYKRSEVFAHLMNKFYLFVLSSRNKHFYNIDVRRYIMDKYNSNKNIRVVSEFQNKLVV